MSNLRFSVVACTSEDTSFSVSKWSNHVATSQGYMTARNCSYPQELILQLQRGLSRVIQVQIMSHETHIATKMELFVSTSLHFDRDTTCFSRVGFLTLQDNTASNYKARELKTVHLDHEMTLLKLRIHSCHVNEHNLYRQVGIMAVNLRGKGRGLLPNHLMDKAVATPPKQKKKTCDDEGWGCDATMVARIREIQVAKNKAVVSEDYDQAKRLKETEEQLKTIGRKLVRLKAQKSEAVANEDYDLAKKVKLEIGRVEASVRNNETLLILPKFASSSMRSQVMLTSEAVLSSSLNASSTDVYPEVPQVAKSESLYGGDNVSLQHSAQGSLQGDYEQDPRYGGDDTDREDGNDGGPNPQFRGIPGAANLPDPEEIAVGLANESEELIFVIGPFFTRCFYSNLWNHRDAAIRKVTMEMNKYPVEPKQLLEVCSKLAQSGAGDRIVQVTLSAFGLLDQMVSFGARVRHDDMCRILGKSMPQLVNKLGESQAKIRDKAVAVLGHIAAAKNVGVAFVASHLIRHSSKPLRIRILQGRLLVLKKLLAEFELVSESDFSAPRIMQFLEDSNSLAHQCREIRDVAKDITVMLYLAVGTEVKGFLKLLRPKQLEEYQAAFETAERAKVLNHCSGATAATASSGSVARRDEIQCEIEEQFERDVEDMIDSEAVDEYTCPYCGVIDKKCDSDCLDQHLWGNCKMLTPCKMCGQVIEISTLNEHLLAECKMQQNHRECPRCGEAIITKFYERHVSLGDCPHRAPLNSANRCPLCHDDIVPGEKGWRRHLLDEGCPNNPRS